jgi:hypothetical protein
MATPKAIAKPLFEGPMCELGQSYKRTDLHKQYGGQRQGGISTPRRWPFLFLFTGKSGSHFGYEDNWHDGLFLYTGEGQSGDMQFRAGNKAIRSCRRPLYRPHVISANDSHGYIVSDAPRVLFPQALLRAFAMNATHDFLLCQEPVRH